MDVLYSDSDSTSVSISDAYVAPVISNLSPSSGTTSQSYGVARTISATVTDSDGDISTVKLYYYNLATGIGGQLIKNMSPSGSTYSYTINDDTSYGVTWKYKIVVTDARGKTDTEGYHQYTHNVDTTKPTFNLPTIYNSAFYTNPSAVSNGNKVSVYFSDPGSGFSSSTGKEIHIEYADSISGPYSGEKKYYSSTVSYTLSSGDHGLSIYYTIPSADIQYGKYMRIRGFARDVSNNYQYSSWSSGYYGYDNTNPTSGTPTLNSDQTVTNAVSTFWSAAISDTHGDIVLGTMYYSINNGANWSPSSYTPTWSNGVAHGQVDPVAAGSNLRVYFEYRDSNGNPSGYLDSPFSEVVSVADVILPVVSSFTCDLPSTDNDALCTAYATEETSVLTENSVNFYYRTSSDDITWGDWILEPDTTMDLVDNTKFTALMGTFSANLYIQFKVEVLDSSSNTASDTSSSNIVPDTDDPVILNLIYPTDRKVGDQVSISVDVTDLHSNIDVVELRYCIAATSTPCNSYTTTLTLIQEGETSTYSNSAPLPSLSEYDAYYFYIYARDTSGNSAIKKYLDTSNYYSIEYGDSTAPILSVWMEYQLNSEQSTYNFIYTFTDNEGFDNMDLSTLIVHYQIGTGTIYDIPTNVVQNSTLNYDFVLTGLNIAAGENFYIWITMSDLNDNEGNSVIMTYTVQDWTDPTINSVTPSSNPTTGQEVTVTVTADDNMGLSEATIWWNTEEMDSGSVTSGDYIGSITISGDDPYGFTFIPPHFYDVYGVSNQYIYYQVKVSDGPNSVSVWGSFYVEDGLDPSTPGFDPSNTVPTAPNTDEDTVFTFTIYDNINSGSHSGLNYGTVYYNAGAGVVSRAISSTELTNGVVNLDIPTSSLSIGTEVHVYTTLTDIAGNTYSNELDYHKFTVVDGEKPSVTDNTKPSPANGGVVEYTSPITLSIDTTDEAGIQSVLLYYAIFELEPVNYVNFIDLTGLNIGDTYSHTFTPYIQLDVDTTLWYKWVVTDISDLVNDDEINGYYIIEGNPLNVEQLQYLNSDNQWSSSDGGSVHSDQDIQIKLVNFEFIRSTLLFGYICENGDDTCVVQTNRVFEYNFTYRVDADGIPISLEPNGIKSDDMIKYWDITGITGQHTIYVSVVVTKDDVEIGTSSVIFYTWDHITPTASFTDTPATMGTADGFSATVTASDASGIYNYDTGLNQVVGKYEVFDDTTLVFELTEVVDYTTNYVFSQPAEFMNRLFLDYTLIFTVTICDGSQFLNEQSTIIKQHNTRLISVSYTLSDTWAPQLNLIDLNADTSANSFTPTLDFSDPENMGTSYGLSDIEFQYQIVDPSNGVVLETLTPFVDFIGQSRNNRFINSAGWENT